MADPFNSLCAQKHSELTMIKEIELRVASSQTTLADFLETWKAAEAGHFRKRSVLTFDSWETLCSAFAAHRYDLLRHLKRRPAQSVAELASALGRPEADVQEDIAILDAAGLLDCSGGWLKPAAEKFVLLISEVHPS
jgi:predicted transcriptional regulator